MNGADSEPRRQLPTTAAREITASQPKWRQLCVEYGGLLEIVFLCDQSYFCRLSVYDWFLLSESMCMLYEISWAIAMCILPFFSL